MNRFAAVLLLVPPVAYGDAGGFINVGPSFVSFEQTEGPDRIEYDNGSGFNLTGGVRWSPGLMIRGSFLHTSHDGGTVNAPSIPAFGTFTNEVEIEETRLGIFYAPAFEKVVGFRAGGGFEKLTLEIASLSASDKADGLFVEGAVLLRASRFVSFDIGAALMALEDDGGDDVGGAEFGAKALFDFGGFDFSVGWRALSLVGENTNGPDTESDAGEFRITLGGNWGYAS